MNRAFSVYLDAVRFIAACLVYIYHSNQRLLVKEILPASTYGHSSVIVFFVLSGFVIAYITDTKEKHWATYTASRLSRVYSVALPALLLTLVLDSIGRQLYPALYAYPFDQFLVRSISSLLMLNEIWFVSITSFSNVPYWSICYELWYYVGFGLLMFLPRKLGWWAAAGLGLVLGPKILLLAPIWAAGVVLYRWQRLHTLPMGVAWALVVLSTIGIVAFHVYEVEAQVSAVFKGIIGKGWHTQLTFSKFFISDYLLAVLVFANFAGMRRVAPVLGPMLLKVERPIRFLAAYTFTLYLLHQPLFLFWAAVLRGDPSGYGYWAATTVLLVLSVLAVGYFTENKRHALRIWLEAQLRGLGAAFSVRAA
ncbi:acyltransferase family protein [Chitinimonas sp. PSY-7]|uniref:acyltransferase family protein n=1 Tax=Chitinimonas sp. PSY-7 TaxID=3459088 RepID=UPI0040403A20